MPNQPLFLFLLFRLFLLSCSKGIDSHTIRIHHETVLTTGPRILKASALTATEHVTKHLPHFLEHPITPITPIVHLYSSHWLGSIHLHLVALKTLVSWISLKTLNVLKTLVWLETLIYLVGHLTASEGHRHPSLLILLTICVILLLCRLPDPSRLIALPSPIPPTLPTLSALSTLSSSSTLSCSSTLSSSTLTYSLLTAPSSLPTAFNVREPIADSIAVL